jgi:hypothetical protein
MPNPIWPQQYDKDGNPVKSLAEEAMDLCDELAPQKPYGFAQICDEPSIRAREAIARRARLEEEGKAQTDKAEHDSEITYLLAREAELRREASAISKQRAEMYRTWAAAKEDTKTDWVTEVIHAAMLPDRPKGDL